MITFLDENDVEYGALATIKATNAVNGERSITGEIISGDIVLSRIERGWRLRFDDEYYVVTYAKPIDEGRDVQVEFDAVHQFFWDFDKSSVYDQLSDGSHTFVAYLDFIFKSSGYSYTVDSALNVYAFEKQSFGFKKRLTLFNDIITSTGVEFQVNGKVVRILEKVGTDLSTVVRKNFNMNELTIEKNIGDFVTYQKGFGAYFDEEDHSKGRLEVEYTSPLASVYGRLEAEPFVDERYSQSSSLLAVLKENVDNSYTISVSLDMEDLTRAGYKYKQPVAGDYIMAINETLGFQEKIRIVSFTSEYDVQGMLVKHGVTCNDIGSVKKLSASYTHTQHQAANAEVNANTAYEYANKALISADGKNTNYYGDSFPVDNPKGTLKKGDLLFLTVGDTVKQYYWNGAEWVTNPVVSDVEAFKEQIAEDLKDVPNREEFENKIAEELANSKAEIETQIETAKTQAESNAKEYADTINQETAKVAELANAAADEIKADLVNVKNNLTSTSLVANNAQAAVDAAKQELANVTSDLNTAKQDLTSHAQQLQTQANAQTELTKRVTTVETTANGTKTTVNELTKTVGQNGKDITSVTNRTKTVEDDLANTKTTLTQVQTTADSTSQKTAILETGLNGVKADLAATTATADTTKTNLANYQASNDRAVASLQSSMQTANGNISSLKTKVEAVPGQITSAVSAVEGKIPTNVSTRNLILKSNDFANPHKQNGANTTVTSTNEYFVIKSTGYTANAWGGMSWNMSISEMKAGEQFSILMPVYIDSSIVLDGNFCFELKRHDPNTRAYIYYIPTDKKGQWFNVAITFKVSNSVVFDTYPFYIYLVKNGLVRIKPPILVRGNLIPSDFQPAFEDTKSDVTKLDTTLTQTANGLKQLSTQVTSQGNTITSHTNSINSLTTGLQAKVSQSDFNTLSGRVTTAENNITAKANELSSKITSVEGKIPTGSGLRNYALKTGDSKSSTGGKLYDLSSAFDDISSGAPLRIEFDWSVTAPTTTSKFRINRVITYSDGTPDQWSNIIYKDGVSSDIITSSGTGHFSGTLHKVAYNGKTVSSRYLNLNQTTDSGRVTISNLSVRIGSLKSDWQPAPEDYDSKLATVQSEIKQTTDSIKASVQSLDNNTVKSSSLTINTDGVVIKAGKSTSDFANAVGSYFSVNQKAINLFSDKINVKGNMIVSGAITSDKIASKSINTAHLNGKIITADVISSNAVTANAIKAGAVTTDKMSANSINGDRITAGTLDAAKIKAGSITASQIASGTITSAQIKAGTISAANIAAGAITGDNIKANSVDVSKIVGIDANFIKSKIEYAMIDWLKGKTITAYNDNMTIDLQNGRISFKDGSNAVYRQTSDGIHTGFVHFEAGSQGGIYAAFGATSTRQGINSKSSEFAGIRCYRVSANGDSHAAKIDKIELIGDTVQFGHTYYPNGTIGGGFIMNTAAYFDDPPYSLNRMVSSIDSLWRILYVHGKNVGYNLSHPNFINALKSEYEAWHDMHNR